MLNNAKQKQNNFTIWYNGDKILSRNKLFNFVIGHRGVGKSYFFKRLAIRKFIKTGKQFVWLRRYKTEVQKARSKWFDDIKSEFPNHKLEIKGNTILVDGKIAGWFLTLSISSSFKSVPFPNVSLIVFDEFLIDKSTFRYLKDEVFIFLDLYETIARKRNDVIAVFIGNAISFVNPYFLFFGIQQTGKEFFDLEEVCVQHYENELFIESKKQTRFGKLIRDTEYESYAVENNYVQDSKYFIENRSKTSVFRCAFFYKKKYLGCWLDADKGRIYVSNEYEKQSSHIYTIQCEDHRPNMLMLKGLNSTFGKELKFAFANGCIRFADQTCKTLFLEILFML